MAQDIVVIDLEMTCWEGPAEGLNQEVIEIGAVRLAQASGATDEEFSALVRPTENPVLSNFCVKLTGIQQSDVKSAEPFSIVFANFVNWLGNTANSAMASWGSWDEKQLRNECARKGIKCHIPLPFINLKEHFARLHGNKKYGAKGALLVLGMHLEGSHHRALDDARNISRIVTRVWPDRSSLEDCSSNIPRLFPTT
jgi:3'-5' exoribonuclease 1